MNLNHQIAQEIARKAQTILRRDILITDLTGTLLVDTNDVNPIMIPIALNVSQTGLTQIAEYKSETIKWWPFIYEEQTLGVFGICIDREPITSEAMMLVQGLSEVLVYQNFLTRHVQSPDRLRANLINTVLTSTSIGDEDDIHRQADILQITLRVPQSLIIFEIEDYENTISKKLDKNNEEDDSSIFESESAIINNAIMAGFNNYQGNIVAYLGDNRFVVLKGIGGQGLTTQNTIRFLNEKAAYIRNILMDTLKFKNISIGIGQYYVGLTGLRKSYQDAKLALDVGVKVWGSNRNYHIKDVGMFITLANTSQERKAELAHQILYPLLRDEQLYKTVQTFLDNGLNLTEASVDLHIHRNTLIYRLEKTKKLVGLDPRHFDDALQIKLGLMFYQ